jgi:acyl-CoA dehydrogenase
MDFELDDDQLAVRELATDLARRFEDRYWQEVDEQHRFPVEFATSLTEHGLLGIAVPEEFGGSGNA